MRLYRIDSEDVEATISDPVTRELDERGNARSVARREMVGLSLSSWLEMTPTA
jgi:hypothetical protein